MPPKELFHIKCIFVAFWSKGQRCKMQKASNKAKQRATTNSPSAYLHVGELMRGKVAINAPPRCGSGRSTVATGLQRSRRTISTPTTRLSVHPLFRLVELESKRGIFASGQRKETTNTKPSTLAATSPIPQIPMLYAVIDFQ
jgi:hypothetical protein